MSTPPPPGAGGTTGASETGDGSPFTRPGFLVSAAVVLVLVVLAGFLTFTGGDDDGAAAPAPSTSSASGSTSAGPSATASSGDCDPPTGDAAVPVEAPDTQWELVGTVAAPSSADAGPTVTDPDTGVRSCYARTPTGALFAATNFLAAVNNPDTLVAAVEDLAAAGPGRDTLLELARTDPTAVLGTGTGFQVAGFTFLSATEDVTSVSIAIGNTGGLAGVPLTVVYEDGDWKVDLPPDGDVAGGATAISSLAGYVPWAGA